MILSFYLLVVESVVKAPKLRPTPPYRRCICCLITELKRLTLPRWDHILRSVAVPPVSSLAASSLAMSPPPPPPPPARLRSALALAALAALAAPASAAPWAHGWSSGAAMLWADFNSPLLLDAPTAASVASLYQIFSVEKCFGQAQGLDTEDAFLLTAAQIKALSPTTKMLFYLHMIVDIAGPSFKPCYAAGRTFLNRTDLWLRNDTGAPLMNGPFLEHDLTLADMARYMVDTPLGVLKRNPSLFDGVFADGALASPYDGINQERNDLLNAAVNQVGLAESLALNAAAGGNSSGGGEVPDIQVIGNGLAQYHSANPGFPADDGFSMVAFFDGVCVEHFAAFEMTNSDNCSLVPSMFQEMLARIAATAALNKTVLIKGWPGPITLPISSFGPSWPASCGGGDGGDSHAARAAGAAAWFTPSYALFLLAAEPTVYWSYSWWYDLRGCAARCALPPLPASPLHSPHAAPRVPRLRADDGYYPPANASMANTTSAPLGWCAIPSDGAAATAAAARSRHARAPHPSRPFPSGTRTSLGRSARRPAPRRSSPAARAGCTRAPSSTRAWRSTWPTTAPRPSRGPERASAGGACMCRMHHTQSARYVAPSLTTSSWPSRARLRRRPPRPWRGSRRSLGR